MGTKRHVLVDARGVPLSLVVTGANRQDVTQVEEVLAARVRRPRGRTTQNLCADKGYQSAEAEEIMRKYRYTPHIRSRGEDIALELVPEMERRAQVYRMAVFFGHAAAVALIEHADLAAQDERQHPVAALFGRGVDLHQLVFAKVGLQDQGRADDGQRGKNMRHQRHRGKGEPLVLRPVAKADLVAEDLFDAVLLEHGRSAAGGKGIGKGRLARCKIAGDQ